MQKPGLLPSSTRQRPRGSPCARSRTNSAFSRVSVCLTNACPTRRVYLRYNYIRRTMSRHCTNTSVGFQLLGLRRLCRSRKSQICRCVYEKIITMLKHTLSVTHTHTHTQVIRYRDLQVVFFKLETDGARLVGEVCVDPGMRLRTRPRIQASFVRGGPQHGFAR